MRDVEVTVTWFVVGMIVRCFYLGSFIFVLSHCKAWL